MSYFNCGSGRGKSLLVFPRIQVRTKKVKVRSILKDHWFTSVAELWSHFREGKWGEWRIFSVLELKPLLTYQGKKAGRLPPPPVKSALQHSQAGLGDSVLDTPQTFLKGKTQRSLASASQLLRYYSRSFSGVEKIETLRQFSKCFSPG